MKPIFLIVGPSGSGKSTAVDLVANHKGLNVLQSYTDRAPRYGGEKGHIFVSTEKFKALAGPNNCNMVAYTFFNNHHYGATTELVDNSDLYVIDPAGVRFMKEHYHGKRKIIVVGFIVDPQYAMSRMIRRGDTGEQANARLQNDAVEFAGFEQLCDYLIDTNKLGIIETAEELDKIITTAQTEETKNVIELPCAVGDKMYYLSNNITDPIPVTVTAIVLNSFGVFIEFIDEYCRSRRLSKDEIGKSLFFDRVKAETEKPELDKITYAKSLIETACNFGVLIAGPNCTVWMLCKQPNGKCSWKAIPITEAAKIIVRDEKLKVLEQAVINAQLFRG